MSDLPYRNLTPDLILDAVESCGHRCDGRQYPLNSFENRVYQVSLDDGTILVAVSAHHGPSASAGAGCPACHLFVPAAAS